MPLFADLDITLFVSILCSVLYINFLLFRRLLLSMVDPVWFLVIINTTVTLSLVIYDQAIEDKFYSLTVLYVVLAHLAFVVAARITRKFVLKGVTLDYLQRSYTEPADPSAAAFILKISTVLLIGILFFYLVTGLPALASDPELARVLSKKGGAGMVARLFNVFAYLSLTLWFYCRLKKIALGFVWSFLGIAIPVFLLITVGAKASLLSVYISFFYVSFYVAYENGKKFRFSSKYFFITTGLVLTVSFVLLFARAGEAGATDAVEFAGVQLLGRIIFSGVGAAHYFSAHIPALADLNVFDYFHQYVVLPILAPLRVFDYEPTVGSLLAMSLTGDDTFGPNPSMYAEGAIYFGRVFGVIYCATLGVLFSFLRYFPLVLTRSPAFFRMLIFSISNLIIMTITYDMILFVGDLINFVFFVVLGVFIFTLTVAAMRHRSGVAGMKSE